MRIVFFGSSNFVVPILEDIKKSEQQSLFQVLQDRQEGLAESSPNIKEILEILVKLQSNSSNFAKLVFSPIQLIGAVTQSNNIHRGKTIKSPVAIWSENNFIKLFQPEKLNNEFENWEAFVDNIFDISIIASFGQIIGKKYLEKGNWINWHPSKLPEYRGPSPLQQAIADGKENTALSWIKVEKAMDAGEIYLQIPVSIENKNFFELSWHMSEIGKQTWPIAVLHSILCNQSINLNQSNSEIEKLKNLFSLIIQDQTKVSFTPMLSKENSLVDPQHQTAQEIYNHYKAYIEYPKTYIYSKYFEQKVRLDFVSGLETEMIENAGGKEWHRIDNKCDYLLLSCKNNSWLKVESITLENGKQVILKGLQL
jgi:methionyl-tRNA formyltransferase